MTFVLTSAFLELSSSTNYNVKLSQLEAQRQIRVSLIITLVGYFLLPFISISFVCFLQYAFYIAFFLSIELFLESNYISLAMR